MLSTQSEGTPLTHAEPAHHLVRLLGWCGHAVRNSIQPPVTQRRVRQESWQRIGGASPPRGRSSQPPRPRVMHEVLSARTAVTLVHRASRQWIERPREEFHCEANLIGRASQSRKTGGQTP